MRNLRASLSLVGVILLIGLVTAAEASAHWLSVTRARRAANAVAYDAAKPGDRYGVLSCRRSSPHRVSCRIGLSGARVDGGQFTCAGTVTVALNSFNNRIRVRESGVACN
jgi:hypothetical protein